MKKAKIYITLALCAIAVLSFTLYGCAGGDKAYGFGRDIHGNLPNENYQDGESVIIDEGTKERGSAVVGEGGSGSADGESGGGDDEPREAAATSATYIKAKVSSLAVRSAANTNCTIVGTLDKGDLVAYVSVEGGFYKTYYKNKTAYVSKNPSYTEIFELALSGNKKVEDTIDAGLRLLGTPYVYGAVRLHSGKGVLLKGFSVSKFDCSSLMQYMFYYGASVNIDVNTRTQVKQGIFVAKPDIARGDLIFFTNASRKYRTGIERVGHVALYLGGNYILHTASDHAVIEQISSLRWSYYIETRRMV